MTRIRLYLLAAILICLAYFGPDYLARNYETLVCHGRLTSLLTPVVTLAACLLMFPIALPTPRRRWFRSFVRRITVTILVVLSIEVLVLGLWNVLDPDSRVQIWAPKYGRLPGARTTELYSARNHINFNVVFSSTQNELDRWDSMLTRWGKVFGLFDCGWLLLATHPEPPPGEGIAFISMKVPTCLATILLVAYPFQCAVHEPLRRRIRRRRGLCIQCGYNLSHNTSGVCPECGTRA